MKIAKYSFGIGDRFGLQGKAQLEAIIKANEAGIPLVPVWNKSGREHKTIHSTPDETRMEADNAVRELNWKKEYYVDADHINMENVDAFMDHSDFFTIDVADYIGRAASNNEITEFVVANRKFTGYLEIPQLQKTIRIDENDLREIGSKFLYATKQAAEIYRFIESKKGRDNFITEVSMDEVNQAQSPVELFFILSALASLSVPVQTIAPKFSGRFNKGVDYHGDVQKFAVEFEEDLLILEKAVKEFDLPENLKLSVHSGSDKFSIYPFMGEIIRKYDKGIHVKTAGTTWLEEYIGLALAEGDALDLAKSIYRKAYDRMDELCKPYATVIDIHKGNLPDPDEVALWSGKKLADTVRHIPGHADYNPELRQLVHVGYKIAAEYSHVYLNMVRIHEEIVSQQVIENIYDRHLKRLFDI
jgi:tagaturonate epimerase